MKVGPLGFRRITSAGPLVTDLDDFSEAIDKDELKGIVETAAREMDLPEDGDLSDEQAKQFTLNIAQTVYPDTGPVNRAKMTRLANCMESEWASNWANGLAENTDSFNASNDIEMIHMMFKGCTGITESHVPDDIRFIPDKFKDG